MKNKTCYFLVLSTLVFTCIFLSACSTLPEMSTITKPSISHWLAKPICDIPCWENITPGITDIREALSLLNKVEGIHIDNQDASDLSGSCIWWDYEYGSDNFPGGGMLCTGINNPDIVEEIHISTYNSSPTIYLKDVIYTFGEPDYITIVTDRNSCSPHLLYEERGLVLSFAFRSCKKSIRFQNLWL